MTNKTNRDIESHNDGDWHQLSDAIDVYASVVCEPAVALKQGYLLWRRKWRTSADSRPKTALVTRQVSNQQSAMQMNGCRHIVPLYQYHATNYNY